MEEPIRAVTHTPKVDIIIVGAGLSGLMSAVKILQKERTLQVKILETSNTVGGRIEETSLGEIGAKWISEDQYHIHRLLQQWKIPMRKRVVLAPELPRCWDLDYGLFSILAKYELMRYINELELRVQFFRPGHYNIRDHCTRHSRSMHMHICNRLFFNKSRKFMDNLVQLISGVSAQNISYAEFMSICCTCGGLRTLIDLYIECPETLLEISSQKLIQVLLEKLKSAEILVWRKVYGIRQFRDYVEVRDSEYEIHTADTVILAVPWNQVREISISPPIPTELQQWSLSAQKRNQVITSFLAKYHEGYWRTAGYSGSFLNSTPLFVGHEYRPTIYSGITVHDEPMESAVRSKILEILAAHFGEQMLFPEEFQQRSYELNAMLNVPLTTPWHRIIWSSSAAAATSYRGCIGGAVQSGLRAAMNSLLLVRPQAVSWHDIIEIQRYDALIKPQSNWLSLLTSTWNLYNFSYYTLITCSTVIVIQNLFRRFNHRQIYPL